MIAVLADTPHFIAETVPRGADAAEGKPYSGFNICPYISDDAAHISRCRQALAEELGIETERIVMPLQTHSANVSIVGGPTDIKSLEHVDALVTRCRCLAIGVNTADCVPVLLADEEAGVIAAVHSGWRGTVAGIVPEAVRTMQTLGATPLRIKAFIGPCIHQCCFETGREVADLFPADLVLEYGEGNPHVDLPGAVIRQLADAGLPVDNITEYPVCSRCNPLEYCSARGAGFDSARTFSFIMLKD